MDGVHDLKRTIRVLMFEAFKDKVHIGCDRISTGIASEGKVSTVRLVGVTQPDEGI